MEEKETFSFSLKKELLENNIPEEEEQVISEFLGYFFSENFNKIKQDKYEFRTNNEYNLEYLNRLMTYLEIPFEAFTQEKLFIAEIDLKDEIDNIIKRFDKNIFSQESFLKGLFLGGGYISISANNYHLSFRIRNIFSKKKNIEIFDYVFEDQMLEYKILEYKSKKISSIYFKKAEDLNNIIGLIGANKAYLELQNIRVMREVVNNLNRTINFETANMTKSFSTSLRQISKIEKIREVGREHELTEDEVKLSKVRIKYPDYTLQEIAEVLNISKSTAYARMNRIESKADAIIKQEKKEQKRKQKQEKQDKKIKKLKNIKGKK